MGFRFRGVIMRATSRIGGAVSLMIVMALIVAGCGSSNGNRTATTPTVLLSPTSYGAGEIAVGIGSSSKCVKARCAMREAVMVRAASSVVAHGYASSRESFKANVPPGRYIVTGGRFCHGRSAVVRPAHITRVRLVCSVRA